MDESIQKILKMVEEGKLGSEKAAELIKALKENEPSGEAEREGKGKKLKIMIKGSKGDDVNINFPLKFIKASLKAFGKLPVDIKGHINDKHEINMQELTDAIEKEVEGTIMDLHGSKGDDVKIVIE